MLVELEDMVEMTNVNFAQDSIGELWGVYTQHVPSAHVDLLEKAYNLIFLSYPEGLLGSQITEILIDDNLDISGKTQVVRNMMIDNLVDILTKMGILLDGNYIKPESIELLTQLLDFIYDINGMEDTAGLGKVYDSMDIPAKERFIAGLETYYGEAFDSEPFNYIIEDVEESGLKIIRDAIKQEVAIDAPAEHIVERVVKNKSVFTNTLAWTHVTNGGQVGSPIDSLVGFYKGELDALLSKTESNEIVDIFGSNNGDALYDYGRNIIALYLISSTSDDLVKDAIIKHLDGFIDNVLTLNKLEQLIDSVVFK